MVRDRPVSDTDARDDHVDGGSLLHLNGLGGRFELVLLGHGAQEVLAWTLSGHATHTASHHFSPPLHPTLSVPQSYPVQPSPLPSPPLNHTQSVPQSYPVHPQPYPVHPQPYPVHPSILPSPSLNPTQSTPQPYPVLPLLPRCPSSVYIQQEKEQHSRKHVLPMTRRKRM